MQDAIADPSRNERSDGPEGGVKRPLQAESEQAGRKESERCSQVIVFIIEPIFEADFKASSYGFRPKKSAVKLLEAIRIAGNEGHNFVDADIQGYSTALREVDGDRRGASLGSKAVEVDPAVAERRVIEDGSSEKRWSGNSPLLADIYLHCWTGSGRRSVVRSECSSDMPDDFAVMSPTKANAREALRQVQFVMSKPGIDPASGEAADGGSAAREAKLRVSGAYDPQKAQHSAEPRGSTLCTACRRQSHEAAPGPWCGRSPISKRAGHVKHIIATLKRVLRGLGELLPDVTCSREFRKMDSFAALTSRPLVLPAGRIEADEAHSVDLPTALPMGLHLARRRAMPGANRTRKIIVKPYAGKPHVLFEGVVGHGSVSDRYRALNLRKDVLPLCGEAQDKGEHAREAR